MGGTEYSQGYPTALIDLDVERDVLQLAVRDNGLAANRVAVDDHLDRYFPCRADARAFEMPYWFHVSGSLFNGGNRRLSEERGHFGVHRNHAWTVEA